MDTREATRQVRDPECGGGATVWYSFTPAVTGTYIASTWRSGYDTILWVGTPGLDWIDCNDDAGGLWSKVIFRARAGEEVLFMASSCCDESAEGGDLAFRVRMGPRLPKFRLHVAEKARLTRGGAIIVKGRTSACERTKQGVFVMGRVRQDYGRRIIRGSGDVGAACGTRWELKLRNRDFRFATGKASVRIEAVACNAVGCRQRTWKGKVRVRGVRPSIVAGKLAVATSAPVVETDD